MSTLSQIAAKRFDTIRKRPKVPDWWGVLGGVLTAAFFLWLAIGLMSSGARAPKVASSPVVGLPGLGPGLASTQTTNAGLYVSRPGASTPGAPTGTPAQGGPSPTRAPRTTGARRTVPTSTTVPSASEPVPHSTGHGAQTSGVLVVPKSAESSAYAIAEGSYTTHGYINATIMKVMAVSASSKRVVMAFVVAPDGAALDHSCPSGSTGQGCLVIKTVSVVLVDGEWVAAASTGPGVP